MEGGPIVTIFARRISEDHDYKYAIISSLLETIRLRIVASPEHRDAILDFVAKLLNSIKIDESLMLSVKTARVKIERWEKI
jgi:phosphopantetheinyl transferase